MTERLCATDCHQSVCSQELARKMTTQRGHVSDGTLSMSGEKWPWETPESSWCQTCHREQIHAASEWRILILTSLVATPAFVHGHDAKGETQVITLPEPSSLCNRSLPLPKNRPSTGCTSSPSLTAQPLQTIPFVKLFQGEPSLQILHSASSAGSKNVPLYLSERAYRLGNKAELGWWEWFPRIRVSIILSTVWRKKKSKQLSFNRKLRKML